MLSAWETWENELRKRRVDWQLVDNGNWISGTVRSHERWQPPKTHETNVCIKKQRTPGPNLQVRLQHLLSGILSTDAFSSLTFSSPDVLCLATMYKICCKYSTLNNNLQIFQWKSFFISQNLTIVNALMPLLTIIHNRKDGEATNQISCSVCILYPE